MLATYSNLALSIRWACICLPLYLLLVCLYRLTLHPLAKYPGPFLSKLTYWYHAYYAWTGDVHLWHWKLHETYGPMVRTGPNTLSCNSNTALAEIYGYSKNVQKSDHYVIFRLYANRSNLHNTINKNEHAYKRRVLSQAFSDNALRAMEEKILSHIRIFCAKMGALDDGNKQMSTEAKNSGWSSARNMSDWTNYLTFDVLGSLCFNESFNMLVDEKIRYLPPLIKSLSRRNSVCVAQTVISHFKLDLIFLSSLVRDLKKFREYCHGQATKRAALGVENTERDFYYYLLNAKDPETGKKFTMKDLWSESQTLVIAGSDTSSTAFASTLFYLLHNPETHAHVTAEVRSTFSDVEEIRSGPNLNSCNYLRACLDEAMRLSPPITGMIPREVLPGGIIIDGHRIPAKTIVGTPIYTIHHNPLYYPEPFSYKPSRWIVSEKRSEESVRLARSAFCPFSIGPRQCIAKGMAYMEITIALARTIFLYDMQLKVGSRLGEGGAQKATWGRHRSGEYQLTEWVTAFKEGPEVEFKVHSPGIAIRK